MAENTAPKQLEPFSFKPGQSGNPAGRPKGARNKLGEAFVEALHEDFQQHGKAAIELVRAEKPDQYLKVIASVIPKDVNLNLRNDAEELSDDELRERIRALTAELAPFLGVAEDGSGEASGAAKPAKLH